MNFKKQISLVLFILVVGRGLTLCQGIIDDDQEFKLTSRVKQLDQFIHRFNFEKMPDNQAIPKQFDTHENRKIYLLSLFNQDLLKSIDSMGKVRITAFVDSVVSKNQLLAASSPGIIAEVPVTVRYGIEEFDAKLFLEMEKHKNGYLKWVLIGVSAPFLTNLVKSDSTVFFPPNLEGNKFLSITKWLNQEKNAIELYPTGFETSLFLTNFYSLLNLGEVSIESIHSSMVRYHILQIEGWLIKLEHFNRDSENAGWLISSLESNSLQQKAYLNQLIMQPHE